MFIFSTVYFSFPLTVRILPSAVRKLELEWHVDPCFYRLPGLVDKASALGAGGRRYDSHCMVCSNAPISEPQACYSDIRVSVINQYLNNAGKIHSIEKKM